MRCLRMVPSTECSVSGSLSAQRLLHALYVSPTPSSLPSISPSITTAQYVSGQDAAVSDGELPAPEMAQAGVCENAVISIAYSAIMSQSGRLDELRADVLLGNVSVNTAGLLAVQQGFAVTFRTADAQVHNMFTSLFVMRYLYVVCTS
jgi:Protein of unknown function (DUF1619)